MLLCTIIPYDSKGCTKAEKRIKRMKMRDVGKEREGEEERKRRGKKGGGKYEGWVTWEGRKR